MNIWFITQTTLVCPMNAEDVMSCSCAVLWRAECICYSPDTKALSRRLYLLSVSMVTGDIRENTKTIRRSHIIMTQGKSAPTHCIYSSASTDKEKLQNPCWRSEFWDGSFIILNKLHHARMHHVKRTKTEQLCILLFAIYRVPENNN